MRKINIFNPRMSIVVLWVYILILPVDAALGNILGSISLVNYLIILYMGIRFLELLKERKITNIDNIFIYLLYFIFFMASIMWATNNLSIWYVGTLSISVGMFLFSSIDKYTLTEYKLLEKSVVLSGVLSIIVVVLNYDYSYNGRFILNFSRYMDPNFFGIGFVLIMAKCLDNIYAKNNRKLNYFVVICLMVIILLTGSRGALLANTIVIITSIFINNKSNLKKILYMIIIISLSTIFLDNIVNMLPESVATRFSLNEILANGGSGRSEIWKKDIEYFVKSNILTQLIGNGFTTHASLNMMMGGAGKVAHNIIFQALIEGGLVGVFLTMGLFGKAFIVSLKNRRYYIIWALSGLLIGGLTVDLHVVRFTWNIFFLAIISIKYLEEND